VYPGKYIEKNTLCAEVSRVRPPTLAKNPPLVSSEFVDPNQITGHKKETSSGSGSQTKFVNTTKFSNTAESSDQAENGNVKNVVSEIQGQLAFPPPELSRGGQEVWVLAGEKYEIGKGNGTEKPHQFHGQKSRISEGIGSWFLVRERSSRTCEARERTSFSNQSGFQKLGGINSVDTPNTFFHLGDVFAWEGSRYSKSMERLKPSSPQRVKKVSRPVFEMREEVIVAFHQQKKFLFPNTMGSSKKTNEIPSPSLAQQTKERCLGNLIRNGSELQYTAQIIRKKQKTKLGSSSLYVLRRVQPHLFSGGGFPVNQDQSMEGDVTSKTKVLNLRPIGSVVQERDMVFQLSLPVEQSKTGDIVQGLPKIEQLFEGRGGSLFDESVDQHGEKFARLPMSSVTEPIPSSVSDGVSFFSDPARKRFILQRRLVDEIQSVYQSQGVEIADKHVEIIVRQMTSKVKILEKASTPFFPDDIIDFESLRRINPEHTAYEPIIMGITKVAFFTESFISAASFQETKRVLLQSAIQTRVDFLTGLKENVIVGRFIPAGTGQPVRSV
jgi:hypothetical protein